MNDDTTKPTSFSSDIKRRDLFRGGALAFGASLLPLPGMAKLFAHPREDDGVALPPPQPEAPVATPGISADRTHTKKPVYLAAASAQPNVVALGVAEALFWTDIMIEHGLFFAMLMPGERLVKERNQAQRFAKQFSQLFAQVRSTVWTEKTLPNLAKKVTPLVKKFIQYKQSMEVQQSKGTLKSLVWPTFFSHTADEAEHFIATLNAYARGETTTALRADSKFWTHIMEDHLEFTSHLLDPVEKKLIERSDELASSMAEVRAALATTSLAALQGLTNEVIDFKEAGRKGIEAGNIKSIIDPVLADHVTREAVKFNNELSR